jgi:hypothetical protein
LRRKLGIFKGRTIICAAIAQLDRASDYGSEGLGFKSLWPCQKNLRKKLFRFAGGFLFCAGPPLVVQFLR